MSELGDWCTSVTLQVIKLKIQIHRQTLSF